jgi:hypothetical protein
VLSFSTPLSRDGALLLEVLVWVAAFRAVRTGRRARRRAP